VGREGLMKGKGYQNSREIIQIRTELSSWYGNASTIKNTVKIGQNVLKKIPIRGPETGDSSKIYIAV
jgi:hypothetical protein